MAENLCPRCGRSMFLSFTGLCDACSANEERIREAAQAQQRAAGEQQQAARHQEAAARAQAAAADAQQKEISRQRLRESARENQEWIDTIVALPALVEAGLPSARSSCDQALLLLAKIERVLKPLSTSTWMELAGRKASTYSGVEPCPVEMEVTYNRLRNRLIPFLFDVWERRNQLNPSPQGMLQTIARSLIFYDFTRMVGFFTKEEKMQLERRDAERVWELQIDSGLAEVNHKRAELEARTAEINTMKAEIQDLTDSTNSAYPGVYAALFGVSSVVGVLAFFLFLGDMKNLGICSLVSSVSLLLL
jgi:uncharacterized Zn finger protein (UPF0148 family)